MWIVIFRSAWRTAKAVDLKFILSTTHNRKSHWAREPRNPSTFEILVIIVYSNDYYIQAWSGPQRVPGS